MKTSHLALLTLVVSVAACGDTEPAPSGMNGGRRRLGMVTVNGRTGVGYDTDGNADPEGVDFDGDGVLDGEDLDNDGVITVWGDFRSQTVAPEEDEGMPSVDPDLIRQLDPAFPLRNVTPTGEVMEPARVVMDMPAGMLVSRNQGSQGACAAFTVAATATLTRYQYDLRAMTMPAPMVNADDYWASTAWLYARMVRAGMAMCNGGTSISDGLSLLATGGAASWTEQPYRSGTMPMLCETIDDTTARAPHVFRIGSFSRVVGTGMAFRSRVRESLAAGLPVAFGAELPNGFMEFKTSTMGVNVTEPFRGTGMCTNSGHCGGHGMVITGYDDAKSAYRVLNSWGTDWGDRGYLWWDYASLEGLVGLHAFVVTPLPGAPTPLGAPDPMALTMTQPTGSRVALVQQPINGTMRWTLVARVLFNEPVTVTRVAVVHGGINSGLGQDTGLTYGDLIGLFGGTAMPEMGSMATVNVTARLRNGATVERSLMVTVPAPTAAN